jgi:hypothetical protein
VTVKATASPFTLRVWWPAQLLASTWSNLFAMVIVDLTPPVLSRWNFKNVLQASFPLWTKAEWKRHL